MPEAAVQLEAPPAPRHIRRKPRRRRRRQVFMAALLLVLSTLIGGYWYLTDSQRVRLMAEKYLSQVIGGRVTVRRAHLSIFEGLRLDGVEVCVDDKGRPDSKIFSAEVFRFQASVGALISGRLEAARITAIRPEVYLCEDLANHTWNFERLTPPQRAKDTGPQRGTTIPPLPEIYLRSGRFVYSQLNNGRYNTVGRINIDGQLTPDPTSSRRRGRYNRYAFDLESPPAPDEQSGPRVQGLLDLDGPTISAQLEGFRLNPTIRAMLPSKVQQQWDLHQLSGGLRISAFKFSLPRRKGRTPTFSVEVQLENVSLVALPEEILRDDYRQALLTHPGFPVDAQRWVSRYGGIQFANTTKDLDAITRPTPIHLRNVSGRVLFTQDRIVIPGITGNIEGNTVHVDGRVDGYSDSSPLHLRMVAMNMHIPRRPSFVSVMPPEVREEYDKVKPHGVMSLLMEIRRDEGDLPPPLRIPERRSGGFLRPSITVEIADAAVCYNEFPYPMEHLRGTVKYWRDPRTREQRVDIINVVGNGMAGTPNALNKVRVNGSMSPLDHRCELKIDVQGDRIVLDDPLRRALPDDAKEAIALFDRHLPAQPGQPVTTIPTQMEGAFRAILTRDNIHRKTFVDVTLDMDKAAGAYEGFAYPLEGLHGRVVIHPGRVDILNVAGRQGNATVTINGSVHFGKDQPVRPDLKVEAQQVPIDSNLLNALSETERQWFTKLDVGGVLQSVSGRIFYKDPPHPSAATTQPSQKRKGDNIDFDLALKLHDGRIYPAADTHLITDIDANLKLTRSALTLQSASGKRGQADIAATGALLWPDDKVRLILDLKGKSIFTGPALRAILSDEGAQWWDLLRPAGVVDLDFFYNGLLSDDDSSARKPEYKVSIRPQSLSINPVSFPWIMDELRGELLISDQGVRLKDIILHHGDASITLNGSSTGHDDWDINLRGDKLQIDEPLRTAVPKGIRSFIDSVKLRGAVSFTCPDLTYRSTTRPAASTKPGTTPATAVSTLKFTPTITLSGGSMDAGIPLTAIEGTSTLAFEIVNGDLIRMAGKIGAESVEISGRQIKNVTCTALRDKRDPTKPDFRFANLYAKIAGGDLFVKSIDLSTPDNGLSAYGLELILRDVDVAELVGENDPKIRGQLNGSLNLRGNWNDTSTRRGRGLIIVTGKDLVHMPVMFGLLQIANLSLPIKKPFNEASVVYSVQGPSQRVHIERLDLKSANMLMSGEGYLDFATRKIEMVFSSQDPNWPDVPIIGPIKREFLKFRVTGRINDPSVKSGAVNIFTTSVDRSLGEQPPKTTTTQNKPAKKRK